MMIIAANWKMNLKKADASALIGALNKKASQWSDIDVIICPAAPYVQVVRDLADDTISVGGQCCHTEAKGAFTGNISADMLEDCGATHIIIGHSERRQYEGENAETLAKQAARALDAGLKVIFCVGEHLSDRQAGAENKVVAAQLSELSAFLKTGQISIIAYEPVWAIGTGQVASIQDIEAMHGFIKAKCQTLIGGNDKVSILYGGSVNADNAEAILSAAHVDGALVGGASMNAASFISICDYGQSISTS